MKNTDLTVKSCFFVSPFGNKENQMGGGNMPHFELIRSSVKEIIESFADTPIELKRADEIANVGSVQETFIGALQQADIVVAELSATGNANVYYELGIRFALKRSITIPIWQKGTKLPADLQGVLGIEYEPTNPLAQREVFYKFLRSRLKANLVDSPVYKVLPNLHIADASEIQELKNQVNSLNKALKETRLEESIKVTWNEAEDLIRKNDISGGLEIMKIAYVSAPQNLQLSIRYGQILSRQENHDEAISTLQKAVMLATKSEGPTFIPKRELGMAYKRARKPQLAVDWLEKAVEENPSDSDTHGIIGGVHKDAYEVDKAIDSYQRGFDQDNNSTYCLLNILCLLLVRNSSGDKLRFKKLLPLANTLTIEAANSIGADYWTHYDRAHCLLFMKEIENSKSLFKTAVKETKTIGELKSAKKNLDLLLEAEVNIDSLEEIISFFVDSEHVKIN